MGLDATVYLNRARISPEWLDESVEVDEQTGAVSSMSFHIPSKAREACSYRLGNGRHIEHCRVEIEQAVKGRAEGAVILTGQVLSGEDAEGRRVVMRDIPGLKRELKFLGKLPKFSADVRELVFRLSKLVEAAEANRNPIVFS